jgi:myosin heavy subunit
MKLKKITSAALILSSLVSAYPVSSFADSGETGVGESTTSDVLLEISVLKQKAAEIESLKESLSTRESLEKQILALKSQLDSLDSQIRNIPMTSDIVDKHTQLVSQRDQTSNALNACEKKLTEMQSEQSLQMNLASAQKDYDLRKSWLSDPQKRDLERNEVELRVAAIEQKQKELAALKQAVDDKQVLEIFVPIGAEIVGLVGGLFIGAKTLPIEKRDQAIGYGIVGGLTAAGGAALTFYAAEVRPLEKKIDEETQKLEASKKKLELLEEAYNLNK